MKKEAPKDLENELPVQGKVEDQTKDKEALPDEEMDKVHGGSSTISTYNQVIVENRKSVGDEIKKIPTPPAGPIPIPYPNCL